MATFVVAVCPILAVSALRVAGVVGSVFVAAALGIVLSLGASCLGGIYWERRSSSEDVLFGDLMIWGWLQRWRTERRLDTALTLLGLHAGTGDLSPERRAQLLQQLAGALEARDPYTHGHSRRVARYSSMISKRMGLSSGEVARIRTAAAVHDVGKINTPIEILHKRERLTDEEFAIAQRHPVDGAEMVAMLGDEELGSIVRHHHERLDGSGYPNGLAGVGIPLGARIIAVADTFDAITSTRPYRRANPHKTAIDILTKEAGTQLDPTAVRAFRSCYFGRRPLALWSALSNVPERLSSWLGSGGSVSSAVSITKVIATTATAAAVGSAAAGTALIASPRDARSVELAADARLSQASRGQFGRSTFQAVQHLTERVVGTGSSARSRWSSTTGALAGGPANTSRAGGTETAPHERGWDVGQTPASADQGPGSRRGQGPVLGTRQSHGMRTGQALGLSSSQGTVLGTDQSHGGAQSSGVNHAQSGGRDDQGGPGHGHRGRGPSHGGPGYGRGGPGYGQGGPGYGQGGPGYGQGGPGYGQGGPGYGRGGPGYGRGGPGYGHGGPGYGPSNSGAGKDAQSHGQGGQDPGQDGPSSGQGGQGSGPGGESRSGRCGVFTIGQDSILTSSQDSGATSEVSGATSEVSGATSEVSGATSEVSGATSEVSGATSEVSGATSEVSGATSEVSGATNSQCGGQGGGITTGQGGNQGNDGQGGGSSTGQGGGSTTGQGGGSTTGQSGGTGSGQGSGSTTGQSGGSTTGQSGGTGSGQGGGSTTGQGGGSTIGQGGGTGSGQRNGQGGASSTGQGGGSSTGQGGGSSTGQGGGSSTGQGGGSTTGQGGASTTGQSGGSTTGQSGGTGSGQGGGSTTGKGGGFTTGQSGGTGSGQRNGQGGASGNGQGGGTGSGETGPPLR